MTTLGYVLDCSVRLDPSDVAHARSSGYHGVIRYLGDPAVWPKAITPDEAATIRAGGLDLALVWESTAGRALEGEPAGIADAHTAGGWADAIGWPTSRPIYYACDTDATPDQTAGYFHGVNPAIAGTSRPAGAYGGVPVVVAALEAHDVTHGWIGAASSWNHGETTDLAALWQLTALPLPQPVPFSADANAVLLADYGQIPIPSPQPSTGGRRRMMEILTIDGVDYLFWIDSGSMFVRSIRSGTPETPLLIPGTQGVILAGSDLIAVSTAYGPVVRAATTDHRTCTVTLSGWAFQGVVS